MKQAIHFYQIGLMCCEIFAAVTGLLLMHKKKDHREKLLIAYLVFIAIAELFGWWLKQHGYKTETSLFYSWLVIPVEFLFAYWFIQSFSNDNSPNKKAFWWFSTISVTVNVFELVFLKDQKFFFSSLAFVLSILFLVIMVVLFLYEFIRSNRIFNPFQYIPFWVSIAYLVYYLLSFPLYAFYNILYQESEQLFYIYWKVQMVLNMFMYLFISFGLIWTEQKSK